MKKATLIAALLAAMLVTPISAAEAPRFVQRDGHHALLVDDKPFLMRVWNGDQVPRLVLECASSASPFPGLTVDATRCQLRGMGHRENVQASRSLFNRSAKLVPGVLAVNKFCPGHSLA